jgi:hypothetical protein
MACTNAVRLLLVKYNVTCLFWCFVLWAVRCASCWCVCMCGHEEGRARLLGVTLVQLWGAPQILF